MPDESHGMYHISEVDVGVVVDVVVADAADIGGAEGRYRAYTQSYCTYDIDDAVHKYFCNAAVDAHLYIEDPVGFAVACES